MALAALLIGCAQLAPAGDVPANALAAPIAQAIDSAPLVLLGEQHDAPAHHALHAQVVRHLVAQGRLGGVVLEMADQGQDTRALPRTATAPAVQQALGWVEAAWPWDAYAPAVMAAVQAGVPVWGGNLPRAQMRDAMAQADLDATVPPAALQRLDAAMDSGHCGLLPASRWRAMTRIQIERDRRMAATLVQALSHARTAHGPQAVVVLITGATHADRSLGVPLHLQTLAPSQRVASLAWQADGAVTDAQARYDLTWVTAAPPAKDHCAGLRERAAPAATR